MLGVSILALFPPIRVSGLVECVWLLPSIPLLLLLLLVPPSRVPTFLLITLVGCFIPTVVGGNITGCIGMVVRPRLSVPVAVVAALVIVLVVLVSEI